MSGKRAWVVLFWALITLTPSFAFAQVATTTNITATTTNQVPIDPHNQADVARAVKQYFADIPVMYDIAKCESDFTQYNANGTVLSGGSGGMLGVFQINKTVHKAFALTLGDDITTLDGNLKYARYLYTNEGTDPWNSSKPCWGTTADAVANAAKTILSVTADTALASTSVTTTAAVLPTATTTPVSATLPSPTLTVNLKLGTVNKEVVTLQKILNNAGYKIAKSGPGSPGQETSKFGALTKLALQRFQCANNIVCKGSESTTGYGMVGAKTRAALLNQSLAINNR